jgi:ABC-2 type transport system permease protein
VKDLLRLLRWELFKLARRRSSYLGFLFCMLFCIAVLIGFSYSDFRGLRRNAGNLDFDPRVLINGYFYANFVLNIGFFAILPLFAATLAGSQLAGEARDGTLRGLLIRPPSRTKVYGAKVLVTYLWLQLLTLFLVAFAVALGVAVLGGGDFLIYIWEFRKAGPWVLVDTDWIWVLLLAAAGAAAALFVIASLALMLSAMTDQPVVAHVGTLGVFFISSVIQRLPEELISQEFRDLLPTTHMNFWHELYRLSHPFGGFDAERFWTQLAWCAGYGGVFLTIGLVVFRRKDITS